MMCLMNSFLADVLSAEGFSDTGVGAISAVALLLSAVAVGIVKKKIKQIKPYNIRLVGLTLLSITYLMCIWPS